MAMNGNTLGTEITNAIIHSDATPEAREAVLRLWQTIGRVIIDHIQTNARVQTGINVQTNVSTSVSVTTPAGPGQGIGQGTGDGETTTEGRVR